MRLTSTVAAGHTIVAVTGDVDFSGTAEFRAYLNDAVAAGIPVLVDLTDVTFMDSMGLGVLVQTHKRLAEGGRVLVLVCPDNAVRRLLRITALDRLFTIAPTLTQALS
jgi:anti-sigma B factor antagonist